jgi:hypothetical protein
MSACPGVSAITVKAGQAIKTTVTWTNTGSQAYSFDIIVIMGDYPNGPFYLIGKALDQYLAAGKTSDPPTTVTSQPIPSDLVRATPYDLIVVICDWDDVNNKVITQYAACLSPDLITVTS